MARKARLIPLYPKRPHSSGQARIHRAGHDYYLGVYDSPESHAEYERLVAAWRRSPTALETSEIQKSRSGNQSPCRTIADLIARWEIEADLRYDDRERKHYRSVAQILLDAHGPKPAVDLGPLLVGETLERFAAAGWCRNYCNRQLNRLKLMVRWWQTKELIRPGTYHDVLTVETLRSGEYGVKDSEDVPPADEQAIADTLPCLNPIVRAIIDLLLLTGARPSEICGLRPCDLNRTGRVQMPKGHSAKLPAGVWAWKPGEHKTAGIGKHRVILFGPRAQAILQPFLDRPADQYLFRPVEGWEQGGKPRRRGSQKFRDHYRVDSVCQAVGYAILATNRKRLAAAMRDGKPTMELVPHWTPYQLRHNAASRLLEQFGEDVARAVLGHSSVDMTLRYAVNDVRTAARAMGEAG